MGILTHPTKSGFSYEGGGECILNRQLTASGGLGENSWRDVGKAGVMLSEFCLWRLYMPSNRWKDHKCRISFLPIDGPKSIQKSTDSVWCSVISCSICSIPKSLPSHIPFLLSLCGVCILPSSSWLPSRQHPKPGSLLILSSPLHIQHVMSQHVKACFLWRGLASESDQLHLMTGVMAVIKLVDCPFQTKYFNRRCPRPKNYLIVEFEAMD